MILEVHVPERERLVVELPAHPRTLRRRRKEGLALPALGLALAREQGAVDLALLQQRDEDALTNPPSCTPSILCLTRAV